MNYMTIKEIIEKEIRKNIKNIKTKPQVIQSQKEEYGDLSTNFAFVLSSSLNIGMSDAKNIITEILKKSPLVEKIEAISGFVNIWIKDRVLYRVIREIKRKGDNFGRINLGKNRKILIEFVSANPTGPLHIGHGRGGVYGDSIARILEFSGFSVDREYYINDVGTQIELLGASIKARYLGRKVPEDGYRGGYIKEIAKKIPNDAKEKDISFFSSFGYKEILSWIKDELLRCNVKFDRFEYETKLYENKLVDDVILSLKGHTYTKDGALWLSTSRVFDEKDRVLIREDKKPTYFASDLAYHREKYKRGYDLLINLWGTDHHGYIERLKSGIKMFGYNPERLKIILYQLVTLKRGGNVISMSTRKGEFVTLKEVLDEIGSDATRFFLLTRKSDTHLEFDLELAKKSSPENPVYYIQYLHARACSILREAEKKGIRLVKRPELSLLKNKEEHKLLIKLSLFPDEVKASSLFYEPHRIANYLLSLADIFHNYYHQHRVISDNRKLTQARLFLVSCAKIVAKNGLFLLGISAPERM
ncbi:TPA: arginine--tRNA ligase [bacterium]|nr:arginine--tRNA ligase [bacterium]